MKAVARLFADMGDAYVELIATGIYLLMSNNVSCLACFYSNTLWRVLPMLD